MRYSNDSCAFEISVSELCSYVLSSGDLGAYSPDLRAMLNDAEIHGQLESEAGAFYNPNVSLFCTKLIDGIFYAVSGCADGIIRTGEGITVDCISCVRGSRFFEKPKEILLAQLKCYAYFLCERDGLEAVGARITYYNVDTKKTKYFKYRYSKNELREFFVSLLEGIKKRALMEIEHETEILPSAQKAVFPYRELREGQEIMIRESYSAIKKGIRLFLEAPTGTGKTMSSLFPAVRALGARKADKIFYLTAKASTRREAFRAAADIYGTGVHLKTVVISAKEQVCACSARMLPHNSGSLCNGRDCEYARGYYDRVKGALEELWENYCGYTTALICEVAHRHRVCPYELSLDLSELCDIIICDYNYAFDPSVYFRRYFSDMNGRGEKYVFLIDEAHNLADRARTMYSATLSHNAFETAASRFDENDGEPISMCQSAEKAFLTAKKLCSNTLVKNADGEEQGYFASSSQLQNFIEEMELFKKKSEAWLKKNKEHPFSPLMDKLCSDVRRFLLVNEYFGKGFLSYVQVFAGDITVQICCIDPSDIMDSLLSRARASLLFSATLTPTDYFRDVLGGTKKSKSISLPSPFDSENLCVAVADYVSTRFEEREKNIPRFAGVIAATASVKKGNYIAYFPSYSCLEEVLAVFKRKYPKVETVVQEKNMSQNDKEKFLSAFKNDEDRLRIGFCVLGGAFSEGVDLPGSRLIGTIIFGVGLPSISNERNMIRDYVDADDASGYDYAYTYPGMNNVLQAAGRVIRRMSDRGIVVLADGRYTEPKYRQLFPEHWKDLKYAGNAKSLAEIARRFWNEGK